MGNMLIKMGGLFSGLAKLGLSKIEDMDIFDKEEKNERHIEEEKHEVHVLEEKDMIYDKKYRCPVCDREFKSKMVMSGKAKLVSVDTDLRPKYQGIDCIKYDSVVCNYCGYGALTRFFTVLSPTQVRLVKENISSNFKPMEFGEETYSYDEAILRYQLSLANAVVKKARMSERAYACLKLAWLYRGKAESLDISADDYMEQLKEAKEEEKKYISSAYEGFVDAMKKEMFPICGMDESTYVYVTADLARRCKDYDVAAKLVSQLLVSKTTTSKVKERARELKDLIKEEVKG